MTNLKVQSRFKSSFMFYICKSDCVFAVEIASLEQFAFSCRFEFGHSLDFDVLIRAKMANQEPRAVMASLEKRYVG